MTDRYVVDASVVAKWYLQDEAGAAKAASLFRAYIHGEAELAARFFFALKSQAQSTRRFVVNAFHQVLHEH